MRIAVIKGGQLSPPASVIAHCGALVLMCLFCCKQLFLHSFFFILLFLCFSFYTLNVEQGREENKVKTETV